MGTYCAHQGFTSLFSEQTLTWEPELSLLRESLSECVGILYRKILCHPEQALRVEEFVFSGPHLRPGQPMSSASLYLPLRCDPSIQLCFSRFLRRP
jgi:hypothetical protein